MFSTSGTYTYNSPENRVLIDNAYRRLGFSPTSLTQQQITSAQEFANFILQSWPNRGINLWLRRTGMITLIPYQAVYQLPLYTSSVRVVTRRTSVRDVTPSGIAFSSAGGVAANAFDGNPATACTQTAPDGYISYQWPATQSSVPAPLQPQFTGAQMITLVGIQSNKPANYTLDFDIGNPDANGNVLWTNVLTTPTTSYKTGVIQWWEIPTPQFGFYFRVEEVLGATLDIQELYFNNQVSDIPLAPVGEAQYMRYPNKGFPNASAPSNYFVDMQINPQIFVYPAPDPYYNCLFLSWQQQIQDFGQMTNVSQIPARFINALCAEMAHYLALEYAPDKVAILEKEAERQFLLAHNEDRERVPLKVYGAHNGGGII